jgi:hypothetical protein
MSFNLAVSSLAVLTSVACSVMLLRGYRRTALRLLLWTGLGFVCLSVNNVLLFIDLVLLPAFDLRLYRFASSAAGLVFLLYGLIWEAE